MNHSKIDTEFQLQSDRKIKHHISITAAQQLKSDIAFQLQCVTEKSRTTLDNDDVAFLVKDNDSSHKQLLSVRLNFELLRWIHQISNSTHNIQPQSQHQYVD